MEHVLHSHQEISKEDFSKWHNLIWSVHRMDLTWWALEFYCMHWRRCLTLQRAWCTTMRLGHVVPIEPPSEQCMLGGRHDSRPSRHSELFSLQLSERMRRWRRRSWAWDELSSTLSSKFSCLLVVLCIVLHINYIIRMIWSLNIWNIGHLILDMNRA